MTLTHSVTNCDDTWQMCFWVDFTTWRKTSRRMEYFFRHQSRRLACRIKCHLVSYIFLKIKTECCHHGFYWNTWSVNRFGIFIRSNGHQLLQFFFELWDRNWHYNMPLWAGFTVHWNITIQFLNGCGMVYECKLVRLLTKTNFKTALIKI